MIDAQFAFGFPIGVADVHWCGMDRSRIDRFASTHHGVITKTAAGRAGMSRSAWYRALDTGWWTLIHPGVARMAGSPDTPQQRICAAVLAAGGGAMASHGTARFLWDIPGPELDLVDLMVTSRDRGVVVAGARVHRPRDHRDLTPVLRTNIPTTNVLRTLCDLGALEPRLVPGAVGHVITSRMVRTETLLRAVIVHSRQGRAGVPALREALQDWTIDGKPPDSILEPAFARLVRRQRLPPVRFHPRIGRYEVDFLVEQTKVVIECDGWGSHGLNRPNWERGLRRDSDLTARGYIVLHLTYRQIIREPAATATRIRNALRTWAPEVLVSVR